MDFYEDNLKLFKEKIPILYETVVNEEPIFDMGLKAVDEMLNYIIVKDEKKCFIHSIFDINQEINQMFKNVDESAETIIIFGLGCGYALNYINNNYKNVKNIFVIEPSLGIFKKLMSNYSIYESIKIHDNVTFVVNKNVDYAVGLLFEYIKDKVAKPISIVYNISYRTIFDEYYEKINKIMVDYISKIRTNLITTNYFKEKWTYNPLINMTLKGMLINDLFGKFSGKSAIIVSAGPSLNKNIHLLKYAKNKALIAAVGTASKILDSHGITPHFRFAMDSEETEKLIFENRKEDNSILVYSDRVQHEVPPLFKRRLKMILDMDNVSRYIYTKSNIEFETLPSGFSIANTALETLIKLGFKNIIFLGQDMCYTKSALYADGSWLEESNMDFNEKDGYIKVKDIYGNDVYTHEGFIGFQSVFESIIESKPNINYINATEGGIGIKGTDIKAFEKVLEEDLIQEYDYDVFFNNYFEKNINSEDFSRIIETLIELEDDIDDMIKINELRIKGLKKIDRYLNKGFKINKIERETIYLNKYEENLREIESYNNCIKLIMNDIYNVILNKYKYEGNDNKEAILNSKKILEYISYELKKYLSYFKNCLKEVKKNI